MELAHVYLYDAFRDECIEKLVKKWIFKDQIFRGKWTLREAKLTGN